MARDRERHIEELGGAKSAPRDDMRSATHATGRADHHFSTTATAQPVGRQPHTQKTLEERIENALRVVAELLEHDEAYLPIFLRLETERDKLDTRRAALERARAVLREKSPRSRPGPAPQP
ncbi:hypothetical protein AAFO90_18230 [Phaeobacter sp. CAU 1743]|uniref:hypothetical protein n=1 Tax=Phaeobacter sp. CAU 1743 TaxID=3140367 RepID=UPI0023B58596